MTLENGHALHLLRYELTFQLNSKILITKPITMSCIFKDLEKQIVLRARRLIRVLKVGFLRSIV